MAISSIANHKLEAIGSASLAVAGPSGVSFIGAIRIYTMLLRRTEVSGCQAVFLTADSPVLGVRYSEWRKDFRVLDGLGFRTLSGVLRVEGGTHDVKSTGFNDVPHC